MRTPPERRAPSPRLRRCAMTLTLALGGCTGGFMSGQRPPPPPVVVAPAAATSTLLGEYLQLLQKLVQGAPAEQAEIETSVQREYDSAPTPSHKLKLALVLGTPGHPSADLPKAQGLLRELMANPEMLLPGERALAFLQLSQIDDHLTLEPTMSAWRARTTVCRVNSTRTRACARNWKRRAPNSTLLPTLSALSTSANPTARGVKP
jgi:hypothetical protein